MIRTWHESGRYDSAGAALVLGPVIFQVTRSRATVSFYVRLAFRGHAVSATIEA